MKKQYLILLLASVVLVAIGRYVLADGLVLPNPLCLGGGTCIDSLGALIASITAFVSTVVGSLAVLMFVVSGIYFVTSAGNPGKIDQAKKIALYAAIGSAIAL